MKLKFQTCRLRSGHVSQGTQDLQASAKGTHTPTPTRVFIRLYSLKRLIWNLLFVLGRQ